jgi:hypothetical protein
MTQLVLERTFEPPIDRQLVIGTVRSGAWCYEQHRVDWLGSLLSLDGRRMVCRFEARDTESLRQALRQMDADMRVLWHGSVHDAPGDREANVVVERSFAEPVSLDEVQAKEDAGQWCLDAHGVSFVRTFFSNDRKRMLCLYAAPDAEAVATAQRKAGMPVDRVWPFVSIDLGDLAG